MSANPFCRPSVCLMWALFCFRHAEYTFPLELFAGPALGELLGSSQSEHSSDNVLLEREAFMELLTHSAGPEGLASSLQEQLEKVIEESQLRHGSDVQQGGTPALRGGPRIKHVCRRAAVALGTPAIFPSRRELRLSALPIQEKARLLRDEDESPGKLHGMG